MEEIKKYQTRLDFTSKGGGVEIDLTKLGYKDHKMSAYQTYLGGSIANDCTVSFWIDNIDLCNIAQKLRRYYADITSQDYAQIQQTPHKK
jgi:hypothetical protein